MRPDNVPEARGIFDSRLLTHAPVIALVVIDHSGNDGISDCPVLVCVRAPDSNPVFPNALSVPTQRVPDPIALDILSRQTVKGVDDRQTFFDLSWESGAGQRPDPLNYVVDAILSQKLGAAQALEEGRLRYDAAVASVAFGDVATGYDVVSEGDEEIISESLAMIAAVVRVNAGAESIPDRTHKYSRIMWTTGLALSAAIVERDPLRVIPDGDPFQLCLQGMCLTSAHVVLESLTQE